MDKDVDNVHTKESGNWNAADDRDILQLYQTIHVAYGSGYMDVIDDTQRESLLMGMPAGKPGCCVLLPGWLIRTGWRTSVVQMTYKCTDIYPRGSNRRMWRQFGNAPFGETKNEYGAPAPTGKANARF